MAKKYMMFKAKIKKRMISATIEEDVFKEIEEIAKENGVSKSVVINETIKIGLDNL